MRVLESGRGMVWIGDPVPCLLARSDDVFPPREELLSWNFSLHDEPRGDPGLAA